MQQTQSGLWLFCSGEAQEILDYVSENESSFDSIRFYPNLAMGEGLSLIIKLKQV